jgi:hypothetical protein
MPHYSKTFPAARLKNVHSVRRRLTDGTSKIHFYHRPTRIRLPRPDSPEFRPAYEAAERRYAAQQAATNAPEPPPEQNRTKPHSSPRGGKSPRRVAAPSIVSEPPLPVRQASRRNTAPKSDLDGAKCSIQGLGLLMTPEELSARYRGLIDTRTLANWRSSRPPRGPSFLKVGKLVFYPSELVEEWERKNVISGDLQKPAISLARDT